MIDSQLSDGREWIFDTISPSLADVSVFFVFNWIKKGENIDDLYDKSRFPHTIQVSIVHLWNLCVSLS
jgi:hypothetical protein